MDKNKYSDRVNGSLRQKNTEEMWKLTPSSHQLPLRTSGQMSSEGRELTLVHKDHQDSPYSKPQTGCLQQNSLKYVLDNFKDK